MTSGPVAVELPRCEPGFPVTVPHRVVAAPRPLGSQATVVVDSQWPGQTALRLRLLQSLASRVRVISESADQVRLAAALSVAASFGMPGMLPGVAEHLASVSGLDRAADLAVLRQPADLVVLRRTSLGLACELLAVAFPSGWSPASRVDASLSELHGPVADNARLQAAAPALTEALLTKGPFIQHVWGLQPDSSLAHDPLAAVPEPDPAGRWWLRVERQTTTPLPALDRALFWIRPTLTPLSSLSVQQRATLVAAVESMSPTARAYKGLDGDALPRFMAACQGSRPP